MCDFNEEDKLSMETCASLLVRANAQFCGDRTSARIHAREQYRRGANAILVWDTTSLSVLESYKNRVKEDLWLTSMERLGYLGYKTSQLVVDVTETEITSKVENIRVDAYGIYIYLYGQGNKPD